MFTNTAYEALYEYIGLSLHSKFIEIITSQKVFAGLILVIFGTMFFVTSAQFFSRYIPGVLVKRHSIPLSKFARIIFCLFLGIGILKVGSHTEVKNFSGNSWHQNSYVISHLGTAKPEYKVSVIFDLMSRTAEEFSRLLITVIDGLFRTTNSQLEAPNFFFKAVMYAGSASIDDPGLKKSIEYYTEECLDRVLPDIEDNSNSILDRFFSMNDKVDRKLAQIVLSLPKEQLYTCLDVKTELQDGLRSYTKLTTGSLDDTYEKYLPGGIITEEKWDNLKISSLLVNHYLDQSEGMMGVQKGSQLPTNSGKVLQYVNRFFSIDGFLSLVMGKEYHGAPLAASRAQEFSENLARAPHVAGFLKMVAIFVFPWLIFFIVAGRWKVLVYWFLIYFSVLLWAPLWALLYHIVVSLSLSADVLQSFGELSDGVSLYSAELVTSRLYHIFSVYSWLQLIIGTLFTGSLIYFIRPVLNDTESDQMPEAVGSATRVSKTIGSVL